jgi:iron complex outermembrane receptor protein
VSCTQGTGPGVGGVQFVSPNDDCKLNRDIYTVYMSPLAFPKISNGGTPFLTLEQKFGTLELNYSTDNHINLTSVTGFYRADSNSLINSTETGFAPPAYAAENNFHRRDITQEFRGDTDFSGPLNFTGGAFYQDGKIYNRISLPINTLLVPLTFFPTGYLIRGSHRIDIQSYSVFGQIRYKIMPKVEITAGVRWTDERRKDTPYNLNNSSDTPIYVQLAVPKIHSSRFSPEVTITYTPTDDLTLFASAKQGYKSGSFSITVPASPDQDISFGDERVRGGEAGIKSRLFDRQLSVNLAGYYYKYAGLQVGVNAIADNLPVEQTINAGGAKIYGFDFDMTFRPRNVPGLSLTSAINYNHARFTKLNDAPCYGNQTASEGCNELLNPLTGLYTSQNLTGIPLVRAPLWTLNGGFNYDLPVGDRYKLNFGMDAQYTTSYLTGLSRRPDYVQSAYGQLDSNVAFGTADDRWQLSLVGRNLTNKIATGSCVDLNSIDAQFFQGGQITGSPTNARGPNGIDSLTCVARRGRELWARVSVKY